MMFDGCRLFLGSVLLVALPHTACTTESNVKIQTPYYCESHGDDGKDVFASNRPIYITNSGYYSRSNPKYSSYQSCIWQLEAGNPGNIVHVDVINIDLEEEANCNNDYLKLYDGEVRESQTLAKICGLVGEKRTFRSTWNHMTLVFHTNARNNSRGFKLKAYTTPNTQNNWFFLLAVLLYLFVVTIGLVTASYYCDKTAFSSTDPLKIPH